MAATQRSQQIDAPLEGDENSDCAISLARPERLLATAGLMIASAMQAADATIANVALPQLAHDLGGGVVLGAWVVTSYLCATAVVAPLTGLMRRRFGARTLFAAGIGVFVGASLLCSLAPSGQAIIAFRILQGAGGGVIHPLAQAILLDIYPRRQHGRMLGLWGATIMVGPIVGPALGGIITDLASWRWVFAVNLPIGALAVWAMQRAAPRAPAETGLAIDILGVALLAAGVAALQLCLERGVGQSWMHSPEMLIEATAAVAAFVALALRGSRTGASVVRPAVFKDINFAVAAFYNFTTSGLLFVVIVFIPALGQGPLGYDATLAGLTIVPRGILMMIVMLLIGQVLDKVDVRLPLFAGLGLMAGGLAVMSAVTPANAVLLMVTGSTLQAIGGGMLFTALSTIGFSTLPADMRTDATGVYSLLRHFGCALAVAVMTAVLRMIIDANLVRLGAPPGTRGAALPQHLINTASLQAYRTCFQHMAVAALAVMPGIWLFRVPALGGSLKRSA